MRTVTEQKELHLMCVEKKKLRNFDWLRAQGESHAAVNSLVSMEEVAAIWHITCWAMDPCFKTHFNTEKNS